MQKDFDYLKWYLMISYAFSDYSILYQYIEDDKAHDVHIDRYQDAFEKRHSDLGFKFVGTIREYQKGITRSMIRNSLLSFSNQMIVIYSTYIENIIKEYLTILFINHPEKMSEYLIIRKNNEKLDGYISFNKVIENESKESLINSLAEESSTHASKGDTKSVLKCLARLSNYTFSDESYKGIIRLIKLRNKIVHEFHKEVFGISEVKAYTKITLDFLEQVKLAAQKNNLRIHDYIDSNK